MTAGERFQPGQLVGRYQIGRLIGEGGMGAVYEAVHPGLKKRVAIKVLLPRVAERDDARVRFLREGEAASRINHPNVVSVFDVGEDGGIPYLVMEYLEGRTLGELLSGRGPLDLVQAAALFLPVMAAVGAGHECGVVHRDLKPHNIFLAQGRWGEPIPKVLDFGVSKLIDHDGPPVTRTETMLGTACYMSPEQARGARDVDARSDQFTLGLILHEILTGQRAYRGDNDLEILYSAASGTVQPARELRPGLPEPVYALLARMLAVSPSDRFPGVREAARVLLPFAGEKTRTTLVRDFDAVAPAAPDAGVVDLSGGTAVLPVVPEDTTLRHAAVQSKRRTSAGRLWTSSGAKLASALGVTMILGAIVLARRPGPAHEKARLATPAVPAVTTAPVRVVSQAQPASPSATPPPPKPAPEVADRAAPFEVRAFPPEATLQLDGRPPSIGSLQLVLPLAGSGHELRVSAAGYDAKTVSFGADQPPPAEIRLLPTAAAPRAPVKKAAAAKRRAVKRGTNDALIIR